MTSISSESSLNSSTPERSSGSSSRRIRRSKRKRSLTPSPSSSLSYLPKKVSAWKRNHAEVHFHIAYARNYIKDFEGLKTHIHGTIPEFSQAQKNYMEFLDEYVTFTIHEKDFVQDNLFEFAAEKFCSVEEKIKTYNIESENYHYCEKIKGFIQDLRAVYTSIKTIYGARECHLTNIPKGMLLHLIGSFAQLCYLHVEYCNKANTAEVELYDKIVHSTPDLRLYRTGFGYDKSPDSVLSITEVQPGNSGEGPTGSPKKRYEGSQRYDSEPGSKFIDLEIPDNILGQHAGQLLLDLQLKYGRRNADDFKDDQRIGVLGVIADESYIYFTVLEMTWTHFKKLKDKIPLDNEDQATIYYCRPKGFLREDTRQTLIRDFMSLNYMEYI